MSPAHRILLASLTLGTAALACTGRTLAEGTTDAPAATTTASADATTDATTFAPQPTTAVPDPTTGPGATTGDSSTTDPTTAGFIETPDFAGGKACDPWVQDCPGGQKCAPVSLDGDFSWESLACVPVVRDPDGVGEPCEALGTGVDGLDTCAEGHMCWAVDPETELGVCVAQCVGSPEDPHCDDPTIVCTISGDGVLTLCLPGCDPLLQDCPGTDLCVQNPQNGGQSFICVLDASGEEGQAFDPCRYINVCDRGLVCADPALAVECDPASAGCCLPFCDLTVDPDLCPGADQQCLPWYEDGAAPPGFENVGLCGLPS